MVDVNAVLGGEGNGGVIDPRVGFVRDSFVGMAMVLDLMAATGETLSSLVAGLPRYAMVKDQFPLSLQSTRIGGPGDSSGGISAIWDQVAEAWPDAKADRRDGLRLEWTDRWVHVRASNTEPIVRVIAEADLPTWHVSWPIKLAGSSSPARRRCDDRVRLARIRETARRRVR
jgi:phosphomannomutase